MFLLRLRDLVVLSIIIIIIIIIIIFTSALSDNFLYVTYTTEFPSVVRIPW